MLKVATPELGNLDVRREYNDVDLFSSATLQILKVVESEVLNICQENNPTR